MASTPVRAIALVALLLGAAFTAFAAEPAPVAKFTVSTNPTVLAPITFNATRSTGAALTYEWDFDTLDGEFTSDATGAVVAQTYATPGTRIVTLRVTDELGATATTNATVHVDDFVALDVELLEEPTLTSATRARVTLTAWNGAGIADQLVEIRVFYEPAGQPPARLLREMELRTGADGTVDFFLPKDTAVANLPGGHFATAYVDVATSLFGNHEYGSDAVDYSIGP